MTYSVRIERIGEAGVPRGRPAFYEAETEMEAITIATYEVDVGTSGPQRLARVFCAPAMTPTGQNSARAISGRVATDVWLRR